MVFDIMLDLTPSLSKNHSLMQFFEIAFSLLIRGKWGLIEHQYPPPLSWLPYSTYLYLDFHVFHDKAERTWQGNLRVSQRNEEFGFFQEKQLVCVYSGIAGTM